LAQAHRFLDEDFVRFAVEPALADMQYEVAAASGRGGRAMAIARGHSACMRLLMRYPFGKNVSCRRVVVVASVGTLGGVMAIGLLKSTPGLAFVAAIAGALGIGAAVQREMTPAQTHRQAFIDCAAIGLIIVAGLAAWTTSTGAGASGAWWTSLLFWVLASPLVAFGSLLATSVVRRPQAGGSIRAARSMRIVAGAALIQVACAGILEFATRPAFLLGRPFESAGVLVFWGFCFAAIAASIHVPLLYATRRAVGDAPARIALPLLGALLFPIPILVRLLLPGSATFVHWVIAQGPLNLLLACIPYLVAGAWLGTSLGTREVRVVNSQ